MAETMTAYADRVGEAVAPYILDATLMRLTESPSIGRGVVSECGLRTAPSSDTRLSSACDGLPWRCAL